MIKIKCDLCEFQSDNHVNIWGAACGLTFDSGTYKSYLFKLLSQYAEEKMIESNLNLIFESSPVNAAKLHFNRDDCLIIDELNYAPSDLDTLLQKIRNANAHLIIIGRLLIKQLEYGVDAIYSFTFDVEKQHVTFRNVFENSENFEFNTETVVCEDSTSVAKLLHKRGSL